MKNIKKFLAIGAVVFLTLGLNACGKTPEVALKQTINLGNYKGMDITWVKDDSDSNGNGFYVIDDTQFNKNGSTTNDNFSNEKLLGHYNNLEVYFIKDSSSAKSKGFYLFKDKEGQVVPSITFSEQFSSGKSSQTKNIATIFKSSLKNQEIMTINMENKTINVENLTPNQIVSLSKELLDLAERKENENKINQISKNKLDF